VIRFLGHPWTGVVLIAMLAVYLGLVSVLSQVHPRALRGVLGTTGQGLYGHWLPVSLGVALCASVLIATLTRVPLDAMHIGTWCAHLGVIVLAIGGSWYALGTESGLCDTTRTPYGWTLIESCQFEDRSGPQTRELPGWIQPQKYEYLTHPGTGVVRDIRCEVIVVRGGAMSRETLALNHPLELGSYRVSLDSLLPTPEQPERIVFAVVTRPGLPVVWTGCAMIVMGMLWGFYVKPILVKRRCRQ